MDVVIPTFRRPEALTHCLAALELEGIEAPGVNAELILPGLEKRRLRQAGAGR